MSLNCSIEADGDPVELASYVPALVVRRFADRREPLAEAESERFLAAVLFADISGSTWNGPSSTPRAGSRPTRSTPTLTPTLRLVTCGGAFDSTAGHYRSNIIVFATLRP